MTDTAQTLSLVLKSDSDELARCFDEIGAFAQKNALSEKDLFEIQLCLEEVIMNIVNFGFEDLDEHDIHVDMRLEDRSRVLTVRVIDDGNPFDPPSESQDADLDSLLGDSAMSGISYRLVRRYVDEMSYEQRDGRNLLTLTKTLGAADE